MKTDDRSDGSFKDSVPVKNGIPAKENAPVWGTREYESSLPGRYPEARRSTVKSLIAVTRRIAERERLGGAVMTGGVSSADGIDEVSD